MANVAYPQPRWRVTLDGKDIAGKIAPRLMSLSISSERGQDADQLDITLTDHDGQLALPRTGVTLDVALGWDTTGLVDQGTFTVDEVEHAGTPDVITLRARSAELSGPLRGKRTQSWDATTLGAIVDALASRNGLIPACAAGFADVAVAHIDQTKEADINFLTRLGKQHDAVATIKAGKLLFAPVGSGQTATGKTLSHLTLIRSAGDQHRYHTAERDTYTGVKAQWHDLDAGGPAEVVVGDKTNAKALRTTYATQADAENAATAEMSRVQRGKATFELTLALGRADLYPEMAITVRGFKPAIDTTAWLIKHVEHSLGDGGFTTRVECETADAAASEAQ